jgi:hypothetical protein
VNFSGTSVERKIVRGSAELVKEDFSTAQIINGIWLKRTLPKAGAVYGIYASRREIT